MRDLYSLSTLLPPAPWWLGRRADTRDASEGFVSVSDRYFDMLEKIRAALALHQYQAVLKLSYDSLPLVPGFISESVRDYGHFGIRSIPCIEMAARFSW